MSVFTLPPNTNRDTQFYVPQSGRVSVYVESEYVTTVYVFDETNFQAFRAGRPFNAALTSPPGVVHWHPEVALYFRPVWHLVVVNYLSLPTAVYVNAQNK